MKPRWVIAAAGVLALALLSVPYFSAHRTAAVESVAARPPGSALAETCDESGPAKLDFALKDMDGRSVKLADYKGKVILLNFWATWCGPCQLEIPGFVDVYDKYKDRGFVILGVSIDDPADTLKTYAGEHRMKYPILQMAPEFEDAWGPIIGVPISYFIARDGSICSKHLGPVSKDQVERTLKALL